MVHWDPAQYGKFAHQRDRAFIDLVGRIGAQAPRRVVDLGCGSGLLTALLAQRWPDAIVEGIDSSPEMIAQATPMSGVAFRVADIENWQPTPDIDVIVSNAALQWVPTHVELLRSWTAAIPSGGWLAWQVPGNFDQASHALLRELAASPRWTAVVGDALRGSDPVCQPHEYAGLLLGAGFTADVWETTYLHVLTGPDPVLEWTRGTALRPVLGVLRSGAERAEFEAEYAAMLREAYPATAHGTLFPFRRIFCVGRKP